MNPELWGKFVRLGKVATVTGAIMTAIVGVAAGWPLVEPWMVATRLYAREAIAQSEYKSMTAQKQTLAALRDIQIEQATGKRDVTENDIAKWTLELSNSTASASRDLITRQIRTLTETKQKLDRQIESLQDTRWN